jgi:hypothetical protein
MRLRPSVRAELVSAANVFAYDVRKRRVRMRAGEGESKKSWPTEMRREARFNRCPMLAKGANNFCAHAFGCRSSLEVADLSPTFGSSQSRICFIFQRVTPIRVGLNRIYLIFRKINEIHRTTQ